MNIQKGKSVVAHLVFFRLILGALFLGSFYTARVQVESGEFLLTDSLKKPDILSIKVDEQGTVWVVDRDQLYYWNQQRFVEPEVVGAKKGEDGTPTDETGGKGVAGEYDREPIRLDRLVAPQIITGDKAAERGQLRFGRHHYVASLFGGGQRGLYATQSRGGQVGQ